jgi:hypothetical protein
MVAAQNTKGDAQFKKAAAAHQLQREAGNTPLTAKAAAVFS